MPPLPPDAFALEAVGRPWDLPEGSPAGFEASDYYLGRGQNALEVAVAVASSPPNRTMLRTLWFKRHAGRPSPVLCVSLYQRSGTWRAGVCGPTGKDPTAVLDLDLGHVRRICEAALQEPNRHAATRFLMEALPESSEELPGLRNVGMFATHELRSGVPDREDWEAGCEVGRKLLDKSGRRLVEGLGFEVEDRGATTSVLRAEGTARAVAVFLDESESAEGTYPRFGGTSPATHGLAAADRDGLPYVLLTRGHQVRLYATDKNAGVGRKGRAETFIEANLALLPDGSAGYLPLIFGADALASEGSFDQILERSRDFATDLGARLRDRVYNDVVPGLARAVVAGEAGGSGDDLECLYEETLVILFRLLFIAYAEDRELLPYRASGTYQRHALKTLARELADRWNGDRLEFDPHASDLWAGVKQLFDAVDVGNTEWQVPEYGGLFTSDPDVSPIGSAIDDLDLVNADFGPPLAALLVDRGDDGVYGPVDFRSLSVREFGTIYEGLLESSLGRASEALSIGSDGTYLPAEDDAEVAVPAGDIYLHNQSGARKATGSYFTKPFAVEHLLETALEPALDDHVERIRDLLAKGEQAKAADTFFDFRCADIAMGSGHFLVAAVDHIEARLSSLLAEQPIPEVSAELERLRARAIENLGELAAGIEIEQSSLLRRQVARRCIYGVDRNAIAVELARLALWIHTFVPGLPLSLLDRTLVCGDSLTGIGTVEEAADVLKGDTDSFSESLFVDQIDALLGRAKAALRRLGRASDADAREISKAREVAADAREAVRPVEDLFDLLVAVRLDRVDRFEEMTRETIAAHPHLEQARELGRELRSLHFPAAFPEVFLRDRSGFDCLLGNPPWDEIHLNRDKWWTLRRPGHMALPTSERARQVAEYRRERPDLAEQFDSEAQERSSLRRILTGAFGVSVADFFQAFAWRIPRVARTGGWVGVVLPGGAALGAALHTWRDWMMDTGHLSTLVHLMNKGEWVFDDVHTSYRVILVAWQKSRAVDREVSIYGIFRSRSEWQSSEAHEPLLATPEELRSWTSAAVVPGLLQPGATAAQVFRLLADFPAAGSLSRSDAQLSAGQDGNAANTQALIEASKGMSDTARVVQGRTVRHWDAFSGRSPGAIDVSLLGEIPGLKGPLLVFRQTARPDDRRTFIVCRARAGLREGDCVLDNRRAPRRGLDLVSRWLLGKPGFRLVGQMCR